MANGFEVRHDHKLGSRRIFAPQFKLQVLDSYRRDTDCRGNQRATARKYGIHRRQIQKWLQAEAALRGAAARAPGSPYSPAPSSPEEQRPCSPFRQGMMECSEPVDLSLKRPAAKPGYEPEPPPAPKAFRLFRPYLMDNFGDPPPSSPSPSPSPSPPLQHQHHQHQHQHHPYRAWPLSGLS